MTDENLQHEPPTELAASLSNLSRWDDQPTGVWQSALERARPRRVSGRMWLFRRIPPRVTAVAAVLVLGTLLVALFVPARMTSSRTPSVASLYGMEKADVAKPTADLHKAYARAAAPGSWRSGDYSMPEYQKALEASEGRMVGLVPQGASSAAPAPAQLAADRQVIRKANIELKTHDVRAAFLRAAQLLSEARGEYVEQSSLTGQDANIQGSLTLRVAADRLSEVLNDLRGLATVVSETSGGEDVTNVIVDLEARLRNEQRVETELLGLMDSRKDAPLKDILELRDSIGRIRENIERMTAQRERLGRLVSLATVLVIINTDSAPAAPSPDGMGTYFLKQIKGAWQGSLQLLTDSMAFLIRLFVGGAFFWLIAILVVMGLVTAWRRVVRAGASEPAPRLG